nr:hypothetical protein GCM10020093_027440 [Planobispora longispora]
MLYQDQRLRIARCGGFAGCTLKISGQVDAVNSAALSRILAEEGRECDGLVIDIGQVTFIDVSGLRVLAASRHAPPCRAHLHGMPSHVERLLTMVGRAQAIPGEASPEPLP